MGGKSKSTTVGYWYEIAFHSGLGIGPIDAYLELRGGDATAWKGEATHSQVISINRPTLWGGEKDQGGIVGSVDLMFGEPAQQPSGRLAGIFGPQQPAWRGLATLVFTGKYGAMNPYPQKASHKIRKIREGWDGECWYPGKAAIPMPACSGGDPYIYVTTPPYPVYWQDSMALDTSITAGLLRSPPATVESLGLSVAPLGGAIKTVKQIYDSPPESLDLSVTPLGGEIKTVKQTYDAWPESLGLSVKPLGGAITTVVVHYTNWPDESLGLSVKPLGGALNEL